MKRLIGIFCILVILLGVSVSFIWFNSRKPHKNFDDSMNRQAFQRVLSRADLQSVYSVFKKTYEDNNFQVYSPDFTYRIPKIIHVMWLGGSLPEEYEQYVQSWRTYHPDWTILFWTDNRANYHRGSIVLNSFEDLKKQLEVSGRGDSLVIDAQNLTYNNKRFYDQARNYGEKSDILKWEIVYRFGGVYVDTDFECLRSLDVFHQTYDFYTGIQPLDTNMVQLGAALYGAIPNHPILKACVENIKNNQHIAQIVVKTGPIHFTKTFLSLAGKTGLRDIAFPASYFYPCGYEQRGMPKDEWVANESYAVHHWAGSWLKPEAFVKA